MTPWWRGAALVAATFTVLLCATMASAAPARIAVVYDGGESTGAGEVLRAARALGASVEVTVYAAGDGGQTLDDDAETTLTHQDVVFVDGGSDQAQAHRALLTRVGAATRLAVTSPAPGLAGTVTGEQAARLAEYWRQPSQENYRGLLTYLARVVVAGAPASTVAAPRHYPEDGFYRPGADALFDDWAAYRETRDADADALPRIGILFHRNLYLQEDLATVDALIEAVRAEGGEPVALAYDDDPRLDRLQDDRGLPRVDAVIFQGTVLDRDHREAGIDRARALGVPVLSALQVRGRDGAAYRQSDHGLAPRDSGNVARGERDGTFEPLAVAAAGQRRFGRRDAEPMAEQVRWRAARAVSWARLQRRANADKRVVFTFWSESGGKADLGADPDDFLDVPGTLIQLLKQMKARGYDLGQAPLPDRDQLSQRLVEEAANIGGWAGQSLRRRAAGDDVIKVPLARYQQWFDGLPASLRERMIDVWGPPPGHIQVGDPDGDPFVMLPALRFGKVVIAAHPAWGYLENEKALKSADALPPITSTRRSFCGCRRSSRRTPG